jgi:hypothetical protein
MSDNQVSTAQATTTAAFRRFGGVVNAGDVDPRRWLILATICTAALMIVLDVTGGRRGARCRPRRPAVTERGGSAMTAPARTPRRGLGVVPRTEDLTEGYELVAN